MPGTGTIGIKYLLILLLFLSLYQPHEICLNGKTALYNNDKLNERIQLLKEIGIWTIIIWECEVLKELEEDDEMTLFFDTLPDIGPLFPRDAFHVCHI